MSGIKVYQEIKKLLKSHLGEGLTENGLERLTLLVTGILKGKSVSPATIAKALHTLGLSEAKEESIERRIRRIENDEQIKASLCFHPLARERLLWGKPKQLLLIIDPTTQEDRLVMLTISVWYRGRALPLGWAIWPGNEPLEGERFWERVATLLELVKPLLPLRVPVIWLADRAFGTPAFTDLLTEPHWDYVVRVQGQTRFADRQGGQFPLSSLLSGRESRVKGAGQVFKKRGWRQASVVCFWGKRHQSPLCLVSSLPPKWALISLYRRRYPIEASFRDFKSYGWHFEQGQVTDLDHLQRLLIGMALATWVALFVGTQVAQEILANPSSGRRRTRPWLGKRSLFALGLMRLDDWFAGLLPPHLPWLLTDWLAPNWQDQLLTFHVRAFVFSPA